MMQLLKLTGNFETAAIHGAGKNAKMSGTRELLLLDKYLKVGHTFSQLLRNKMARADHGNTLLSLWSTKTTKRSGGTCCKGDVDSVVEYALWYFSNAVYRPKASTLI